MDAALLALRHSHSGQGSEVWLVAITLSGESTPILTVTNNPGDLVVGGVTYTAYNVSFDPPESGDDGLPTANLRISNVLRAIQPSLRDNDYYRGARCDVTAFNTSAPAAVYSDQVKQMQIVYHKTDDQDVVFTLSVPQGLIDPVPEDLYSPYGCRHRFRQCRCGYVSVTITGVTRSGSDPLRITAATHRLTTGDEALLETVGGIIPAVAGVYVVTYVDVSNVTLDGTNSSNYAGSYTSGGKIGYFACPKTRAACRARGMQARFGAEPGLGPNGLRIAS
jgi:hypothetical protein